MAGERLIPHQDNPDLSTFTVLVDGEQISGEIKVISVGVRKGVNMIGRAQLFFSDGDMPAEDFPISNGEVFLPGKEIEIKAGYHSKEDTVFKGIIVGQGLRMAKGGPSLLVIECRDKATKMTVGRKNAYFADMKDSEILDEIIGTYDGLTADVAATSAKHPQMVQYYSTDWDFVVSRAEMNGLLVLNDDGTVAIQKPEVKGEADLKLFFGESITEFEVEMDARTQYSAVKSYSWDFSGQELLEMEGEDPGYSEAGNLSGSDLTEVVGLETFELKHSGKVSDAELQSWADATLLRSRMAKIRGRVKFQGYSDIKPGHTLELNGVGERFTGKVFVAGVNHDISREGWETDVEFGLSPKWFMRMFEDINTLPASELLPGIQGLQIGVVVALEGDPEGEDRIQVRMPLVSDSEDGTWARIAASDAGDSRGFVFRPEIDDEVILGFVNGDPRDPVVLGTLHSSAKPAPIPGSDDNHQKGIFSREGMKVLFDDDKVSLTLETPGGYKVVLDEDAGTLTLEDGNGNKMEMSSSGITIESGKDINIKASGDVNIEGVNGNFKASAQFKAEGSAGAEISSGATMVVKGSIVQIN